MVISARRPARGTFLTHASRSFLRIGIAFIILRFYILASVILDEREMGFARVCPTRVRHAEVVCALGLNPVRSYRWSMFETGHLARPESSHFLFQTTPKFSQPHSVLIAFCDGRKAGSCGDLHAIPSGCAPW
jgi:hypothetical protein